MSQTNEIAEQVKELTEKIDYEPQHKAQNERHYLDRAILHLRQDKFSEALEDATKLIDFEPENETYYSIRGFIHKQLSKYDEAIQDYTKSLEINPKEISVYFDRGLCYTLTEQYTKAIDDFSEVIKLDPEKAKAYYYRGLCENTENHEEAINDFTKAIELDLENAEFYMQRGNTYLQIKNYKKALEDFSKAIEIDNGNINTLLDRILKEISIELIPEINGYDTQESELPAELKPFLINSYDTIIDKYPKIPDGFLHRGIYFIATGQYRNAEDDFSKYIKLNDKNCFVYFLRGICRDKLNEQHKDFHQAQRDMVRIKEQLKEYPLITHTLDYSEFLKFVGLNASIEIMLQSLKTFFDIDLSKDKMELAKYLDKLSFEEKEPPEDIKNSIIEIFSNYPKFETSLSYILKRDGKDIFYINAKLSFLKKTASQFMAQDIWWQYSALEYDDINGLHGLFSQKEINHQFNFTQMYVHLSEALQRQFVEEKAKAIIEERNRIIKNQAHDIKNILSSIISPLMYLQRRIHKPQIEQALKQVDVLSKMVNSTSLSYSGSPEDFFYDAQNNAKGISLREMIVTSVESSLANIVEDIDYYAIFREQYFPDDAIREKALAEYRELQEIPTSERFAALQKFSQKYMCKLEIDFGGSDSLVLGDKKSSGVKLLALFNELIFNAIKYSAFVNENKRFVSICCTNDDKNVYLKIKNSYSGDSEIKTTGTGNLIVDNLIAVMKGKVYRDKTEDSQFITKIEFANFWKGGNSG